MRRSLQILMLLVMPFLVHAQQISGTISDKNGPVIGATVSISSSNGTITNVNGGYELKVPAGTHEVTVSFVGYVTKKVSTTVGAGENKSLNVTIEENVELLNELVVVGTRSRPRSSVDTAVPVDILDSKDLISTGQNSFDKALTYRVPSFNSVQTPVNDATALLDPYEIRNMGPSRTLILINGKRKNLSALLYTQTSPGRGETGADISAIPQDAIERVEILRDGASAQYGSDAIAGVMNIILKDDVDYGSATLRTGITGEGDGESVGISLNAGNSLNGKGFINYTVGFSKTELANRPGTVDGGTSALGAENRPLAGGEYADFLYVDPDVADNYPGEVITPGERANILAGNAAGVSQMNEFLSRKKDAGNINGSPTTTAAKFLVNGGVNLTSNSQLYFNGAYIYKNVNSFANYRTPYWRTIGDYPYLSTLLPSPGTPNNYDGYVPTFDGLLNDYNATVGFKSSLNDWNFDASFTTGGNSQTYKVRNTHNGNGVLLPNTYVGDLNNNNLIDLAEYDYNLDGDVDPNEGVEFIAGGNKYRENSQISFDPGGTRFSHHVGNIDISKPVSDNVSVALGAEFRSETFEVIEGELASYEGGGSDSFAGNTPENSGTFNRYNFGGYFDLSWDVTQDFLLNGTARVENYSDFGQAFVWKLSSRYKLMEDKMTLRASASTGFRAPTLHQIYTQKAQYSFVPGSGIQVGGLVNNVSPQAKLLGVPQLDAEESFNFTIGLGVRPSEDFNVTVDYYNIAVSDRIILSTEIGPTGGNTPLDQVLAANNLSDVSFFVNALDTKTAGIDFVANYKNLGIGNGTLGLTLSGNYTIQNERDGDVKNPALVEGAGQSVVNATQEALFFTSRPKTKWILGLNYDLGKFGFSLNNTYFGKTEFRQDGLSTDLKTEFKPKVVTDLGVNFRATDKVNISFNVNNILNVLPEWEFVALNNDGETILADANATQNQSNLITFNQRYSQMTYDGYHFSQLGSLYNLTVNVRF